MKEFYRHGALVFAGLIAANVLTYVYYATVSRAVGVAAAGLFMSLIAAIMICSLPAAVGGNIVAKMAADARGRGEDGVVTALGIYASLLIVPIALIVAVVEAFGLPALAAFFHAADRGALVLAGISFTFAFTLAVQRAVLQGAGRFGAFVTSNVIEGAGKCVAGLACWSLHAGVRTALGGYAIAAAAATIFNVTRTLRGAAPVRPHLPRAVATRHLIGIALPTAALTAVTFADVVLVRHGLDPYDSGLYAATALFGRAVLTALAFVPTILMPKAAAERAAGRPSVGVLRAAFPLTALGVAGALLVAAFFPRFVLTVIAGKAFVAAAPLVLPYTAAMGALAFAAVFAAYLIALDRTAFALPLALVACVEIGAIAAYHPNVMTVVSIVLAGHCALLACCLVDLLFALRARPAEARVPSAAAGPA
jgi:O-antigen/teichoic acid export membrane protein